MSRQAGDAGASDDYPEPEDYYRSHQPAQQHHIPRLEPASFSSPPPASTFTPPRSSYTLGASPQHTRSLPRSSSKARIDNDASHPSRQAASRSRANLPPTSRVSQRRDFRDLVTQFNQDEAPIQPLTTQERYKRAQQSQKPARLMKPRSPTKPDQRFQPRREAARNRQHMSRLDTSVALHPSTSHEAFLLSASARSPKPQAQKPLFGEITCDADGLQEMGYGIPVGHHVRRGSDSSLFKGTAHVFHVRSPSGSDSPSNEQAHQSGADSRRHSRSRSDQTVNIRHDSHQWPPDASHHSSTFVLSADGGAGLFAMPPPNHPPRYQILPQNIPTRTQSQPRLLARAAAAAAAAAEPRSRTPVSKYSRPPPPRTPDTTPPSPSGRYGPSRSSSPDKMMRANIIAPTTPKSPPLRSSRPRQHVSAATTASSRAKVAERLAKPPAEDEAQPAKPRSRKRDPVLGRVDFAERRARIERAISQHLEEAPDPSRRSSRASSVRRRSSGASQPDDSKQSGVEAGAARVPITLEPVGEDPKSPGLSLDTQNMSLDAVAGPDTAGTEFEEDESPDLAAKMGKLANGSVDGPFPTEQGTPSDLSPPVGDMPESKSLFREVLQFRDGTSPDTPETGSTAMSTPQDSPALRVRIDGKPVHIGKSPLIATETLESELYTRDRSPDPTRQYLHPSPNQESSQPHTPTNLPDGYLPSDSDITPRQLDQSSSRGESYASDTAARTRDGGETYMQRIISEFERTGHIDPTLLSELQRRGLDTHGTNTLTGGSDAQTIQILLDRFTYHPPKQEQQDQEAPELLPAAVLDAETWRHKTSPAAESFDRRGYFEDTNTDGQSPDLYDLSRPPHDTPFVDQFSPAQTAATERDHATPGAESLDNGPTPPPKDARYPVDASIKQGDDIASTDAHRLSPTAARSSRTSRHSNMSLPEIEIGGSLHEDMGFGTPASPGGKVKPPRASPSAPAFVASPQPPSTAPGQGFLIEPQQPSSEPVTPDPSMIGNKAVENNEGARRSEDSQRRGSMSVPPSQSLSSVSQVSMTNASTERSSPAAVEDLKEPSPLQRRLNKRRNVIKELVDTEYSYHQDMVIIEDIYKATAGQLISPEDKKILFGNADQVELLSVEFYDAMRRAVSPFYTPQKSTRWQAKRGSFVTSDGNDQQNNEQSVEEQDKATTVGLVFEQFLPRMEEVYGTYLKNHDAANKRLAVLQTDDKVMNWLKLCDTNAGDLTSAWDLDSLLVKPVQRILKYPLLLQQLLAVTPPEHPDHAALEAAVLESTNISQRINEAKKRAELVDSIVQRKRKDSDMRHGLAKAFGLRTEKVRERIGIKNEHQDPVYEEVSMKFGGHYVRLQVVMRDIQSSLIEVDRAVEKFNAFATALEAYIDVGQNLYPEIESKWRKFIMAIRELANVALLEHKRQTTRRVIDPIVMALRLHETPQSVMAKRKKRVVDYVRCQQMEKSGQKPDKKTLEGSELYVALNEQLKIELPKLYSLTAELIQRCLACHHQIQIAWLWTWEMKLRPVLDGFPESFAQIVPDFSDEYDLVYAQVHSLNICNGKLRHDVADFLSPSISQSTIDDPYRTIRGNGISSRTQSIGSEHSPSLLQADNRSQSSAFANSLYDAHVSINGQPFGRARSSSQLSVRDPVQRGRATSVSRAEQHPSPRLTSQGPTRPSFSTSRPPTASRPVDLYGHKRGSVDASVTPGQRPSRPDSGTSYFSAQQDTPGDRAARFSGIFSSAMPMSGSESSLATAMAGMGVGLGGVAYPSSLTPQPGHPPPQMIQHAQAQLQQAPTQQSLAPSFASATTGSSQATTVIQHSLAPSSSSSPSAPSSQPQSPRRAPEGMRVLFVAASLFEFNIDRARREAGYPYLTYVEGEVFDVVATKGELWLAKNQDDAERVLGWIWEQHFVVLGRDDEG